MTDTIKLIDTENDVIATAEMTITDAEFEGKARQTFEAMPHVKQVVLERTEGKLYMHRNETIFAPAQTLYRG